MPDVMLVVSILLEAAVVVIAILGARQGRPYAYGLAFTFAVYVVYDLARLLTWDAGGPLLSGLFLLATLSALYAVWGLYRDRPPRAPDPMAAMRFTVRIP